MTMQAVQATVPWRGAGSDLAGAESVDEVLARSGLGWDVAMDPVFTQDGRPIPGHRAIVRRDTQAPLGVVGDGWTPIQNRDASALCADIAHAGGGRFEAAGLARGGRVVWFLVELGGFEVAGDEMTNYLLISNSHDGSRALRACITPLRITCSNSLRLAEERGNGVVAVRHTASAPARMDAARNVLSFAVADVARFREQAEALARRQMTEVEIGEFAAAMFPMPDGEPDGHPRIVKTREAVVSRVLGDGVGLDRSQIRATRWSALNGLIEHVDHGRKYRSAEVRFTSTLLDAGATLKRRALVYLSRN